MQVFIQFLIFIVFSLKNYNFQLNFNQVLSTIPSFLLFNSIHPFKQHFKLIFQA